MDVTYITEFGELRYVLVRFYTYSRFLIVTAQTREAIKHVITHCLKLFLYMGTPKIIKTYNGSRYVTKTFQQFCSQWNIEHRAKHSL